MFSFKVLKKAGGARLTELTTPHGKIAGPFFQFVATQAAIRGMVLSEDLVKLGVDIVLSNTYHLHLRPGDDVVAEAGGLHGFMQWNGPVTTDSGGYQVFSLGTNVKIDADGVSFHSPLDGDSYRFTPESTMQVQACLGADIVMPLDVCTPYTASYDEISQAVNQTQAWAMRCKEEHLRLEQQSPRQALYGIVQGGVYPDLREKSALGLREIGFFGYSIGGELRDLKNYSVEEGVKMTTRHLPEDAPRYLMGSGTPEDIVRAVRAGVDQFDCVLPVRNARHGKIYRNLNSEELTKCLLDPDRPVQPEKLYEAIDIRKSSHARSFAPFAPPNPVTTNTYSEAYLHHLMRAENQTGVRLAVLQNVYFYVELMKEIRSILSNHGSAEA